MAHNVYDLIICNDIILESETHSIQRLLCMKWEFNELSFKSFQ